MSKMFLFLTVLCALSAKAKDLSVNCNSQNGRSTFLLTSTIENPTTPQTIKSLTVNGKEVSNFQDISQIPIYIDEKLTLQIQFGSRLYSSVELYLSKCEGFGAMGKAVLKEFVGGFAGTSQSLMNCNCSLK